MALLQFIASAVVKWSSLLWYQSSGQPW